MKWFADISSRALAHLDPQPAARSNPLDPARAAIVARAQIEEWAKPMAAARHAVTAAHLYSASQRGYFRYRFPGARKVSLQDQRSGACRAQERDSVTVFLSRCSIPSCMRLARSRFGSAATEDKLYLPAGSSARRQPPPVRSSLVA